MRKLKTELTQAREVISRLRFQLNSFTRCQETNSMFNTSRKKHENPEPNDKKIRNIFLPRTIGLMDSISEIFTKTNSSDDMFHHKYEKNEKNSWHKNNVKTNVINIVSTDELA